MAFSRRETAILLVGDFLLLAGSLWLALTFRNLAIPSLGYLRENIVPFIPVFLFSLVVFYIAGLYEKPTRPTQRVMGGRIIGAQVANGLIAALFFFVLPFNIAPKTILAMYLVASVALITAWRFYALRHLSPRIQYKAVLVGHGPAADEVVEEIAENDRYAIGPMTFLDTVQLSAGEIAPRVRELVKDGAQVVVIDTYDPRVMQELSALYSTMLSGATFIDFESFYEELFDRVPIAHVDYAWLLGCLPRAHFGYDAAKRLFDLIAATVGGIIALVFIVPAALVLWATGGMPFIFHERIGRGGKPFRIVKLRTMLFNDHGDPALQTKNHVTAFGKFLRKSRIDELPQLWNIIKGDLSFIGPRPELPRIASVYEKEIPYYQARHLTTPGLSGWAQIRDYDAPRGGADIARTRRKLSYDLYYLRHRSFGLDTAIALKTLRALASFSGS